MVLMTLSEPWSQPYLQLTLLSPSQLTKASKSPLLFKTLWDCFYYMQPKGS